MLHKSCGLSNAGRLRKVNEDAILIDEELGVYILCDGCGGHAAGEVASELAAQTALEGIRASYGILEDYAANPDQVNQAKAVSAVRDAVNAASEKVHAAARSDKGKAGMSATIVVLTVLGNRAIVANAGDSPAYLFRRGRIHQITEDHNMAAHYIRLGLLKPEDAPGSRWSGMLTRALGFHEHTHVDTLHLVLAPEDILLLCSDGLTMYLTREELAELCAAEPVSNLPHALIRQANMRGGADNVSAIAVQTEPGDSSEADEVIRSMQALVSVPLFKNLTFHELLRVMDLAVLSSRDAGECILEEGNPSGKLLVSISGTVNVVKGNRTLAELNAGSVIGEMGLIDEGPRSATVIAKDPVRLLTIFRKDFFALLRRERTLAVKVLWGLCRVLNNRLRSTTEELTEAMDAIDQRPYA